MGLCLFILCNSAKWVRSKRWISILVFKIEKNGGREGYLRSALLLSINLSDNMFTVFIDFRDVFRQFIGAGARHYVFSPIVVCPTNFSPTVLSPTYIEIYTFPDQFIEIKGSSTYTNPDHRWDEFIFDSESRHLLVGGTVGRDACRHLCYGRGCCNGRGTCIYLCYGQNRSWFGELTVGQTTIGKKT